MGYRGERGHGDQAERVLMKSEKSSPHSRSFQHHFSRDPHTGHAQCFLRIDGAAVERSVYKKDLEVSFIRQRGLPWHTGWIQDNRQVIGVGQREERTLSPEEYLSLRLYSDPGLIVQSMSFGKRVKIGEPVPPYPLNHWK